MNILILSDIHANRPALQAVLAAEPQVDGLIVLGDVVNHGPHPVECVQWAQANVPPQWIVQGNHDRAIGCDEDPRCSAPYRMLAAAMQRYTHHPFVRLFGSTLIVNPGSVGQPKGGDPRAAYALWHDGEVVLRRVAYDLDAVARDLASCTSPAMARDLTHVLLTGGALPPPAPAA